MAEGARRDRALELIRALSADPPALDPGNRLADVGLDSLAFTELAAAVATETGVDLSRADIGADDRIEDVLDAIERAPVRRRPSGLPPGTGRLQEIAKLLGGGALWWWFALRVVGAERIPRSGPVLLAMNHESALDIPLVVSACPRRITFMAKKELFKNGPASWALRQLGGFRVDRDRFDVRAVEMATATIAAGGVLGMYPEGTRAPGRLLPFQHGAAWLAVGSGVPLVPCSISGTERSGEATRPRRVHVRVTFHEPLRPEPVSDPGERRARAEELTAAVRGAIERGLA